VPNIPEEQFPQAAASWFGPQMLDTAIPFGKFQGSRWGDLLAGEDGLNYLRWMVCAAIAEEGNDPGRWGRRHANARVALWVLQWGSGAGAPVQGPPRREDTPF